MTVESVGSKLILHEKDVVQFLCHNKGQCARTLAGRPITLSYRALSGHTEVWKDISFLQ